MTCPCCNSPHVTPLRGGVSGVDWCCSCGTVTVKYNDTIEPSKFVPSIVSDAQGAAQCCKAYEGSTVASAVTLVWIEKYLKVQP